MSDRIKGFMVMLETDLRTDDAEGVLEAIRHIRHVASVEPVVANIDDYMNRERVRRELVNTMLGALERKPQ